MIAARLQQVLILLLQRGEPGNSLSLSPILYKTTFCYNIIYYNIIFIIILLYITNGI